MSEVMTNKYAEAEKRRQKAQLELEIVQAEQRLAEHLEKVFLGRLDDQKVLPTASSDGALRIRAYIMDEDAGMGYIENTHWLGIARISETQFAVEAHYPYSTNKTTVFTTFNTETGILEQYKEDQHNRGEKPLDGTLEITGDYKRRILNGIYYEINNACLYEYAAYEHRLNRSDRQYTFEIEQLQ